MITKEEQIESLNEEISLLKRTIADLESYKNYVEDYIDEIEKSDNYKFICTFNHSNRIDVLYSVYNQFFVKTIKKQ